MSDRKFTLTPLDFAVDAKLAKGVYIYRFKLDVEQAGTTTTCTVTKRYSQIRVFTSWARTVSSIAKEKIIPIPSAYTKPSNNTQRKERQILLAKSLQTALWTADVAETFEASFFFGIPYERSLVKGKEVLFPLPDKDFDASEFSIPWRALRVSGVNITIASPSGKQPVPEPYVLRPSGVVMGQLGASFDVLQFWAEISESEEFQNVISYEDINPDAYNALHLNGGHAPGMREYCGSELLQSKVAKMVERGIPIGAICHGTLLLARSKGEDGKSVISSRNVTSLPYFMEKAAVTLTSLKLGSRYYSTYDIPCATEVASLLDSPKQFQRGPLSGAEATLFDDTNAWVVVDNNIVTARFPGDAYLYIKTLLKQMAGGNE